MIFQEFDNDGELDETKELLKMTSWHLISIRVDTLTNKRKYFKLSCRDLKRMRKLQVSTTKVVGEITVK